jgi:L-serine deaminase
MGKLFCAYGNEVNAALGRIVNACQTVGCHPSVLMYYLVIENHQAGDKEIKQFLLVAGEEVSLKRLHHICGNGWLPK